MKPPKPPPRRGGVALAQRVALPRPPLPARLCRVCAACAYVWPLMRGRPGRARPVGEEVWWTCQTSPKIGGRERLLHAFGARDAAARVDVQRVEYLIV